MQTHGAREREDPDLARASHRDRGDARGERGRQAVRHARRERHARRGGLRGGDGPPSARDRQADRRRARHDEGRRHEARAGDVLPRRRARGRGAPRGVPARARQAARRRADGLVQADAPRRSRTTSKSRSSEVFATFDEEPIAAASIGQVYRATLHDGREVAVKVQYPGVASAVRADMQNLDMIMRLLKRMTPGLDVEGDRRGDQGADRRGARLRARGAEPALAGADLRRAPVHRRARRRQLALARARAGQRVRQRCRASRS